MNGKLFSSRGVIVALGFSILVVSSSVHAQETLYTWEDEDGVKHFTNEVPDKSCWDDVQTFFVQEKPGYPSKSEDQSDDPDATDTESRSLTWPDQAFTRLSEYVDEKAGFDAVDCGMHEVTRREPVTEQPIPGFECVERSDQDGIAFKHGRFQYGGDDVFYKVVIRDTSATYWYATFDRWFFPSNYKSCRCESLEFDSEQRSFDVVDCVMAQ